MLLPELRTNIYNQTINDYRCFLSQIPPDFEQTASWFSRHKSKIWFFGMVAFHLYNQRNSSRASRITYIVLIILSFIFPGVTGRILGFITTPIMLDFFLNLIWIAIGFIYFLAIEGRVKRYNYEIVRMANFVNYKRTGFKEVKMNYFFRRRRIRRNQPKKPSKHEIQQKKDYELLEASLVEEGVREKLNENIDYFWGYALKNYVLFKVLGPFLLVIIVILEEKTRLDFLIRKAPIVLGLAAVSAYLDDFGHNASQARVSNYFKSTRQVYVLVLNYAYFQIWDFLWVWAVRTLF